MGVVGANELMRKKLGRIIKSKQAYLFAEKDAVLRLRVMARNVVRDRRYSYNSNIFLALYGRVDGENSSVDYDGNQIEDDRDGTGGGGGDGDGDGGSGRWARCHTTEVMRNTQSAEWAGRFNHACCFCQS
jgi:hypothetical protein